MGPGIWKMNVSAIATVTFKRMFETFWEFWKSEKHKFRNLGDWWEIAKIKIKELTILVSKNINRKENDIKNKERELEELSKSDNQLIY